MNSVSVYFKCFYFLISDLHADCVDIVSSAYISVHIPHSVSHVQNAVEA